MNRRFVHHTMFKALNRYRAILTYSSQTEQILTSFGGSNFTLEGFEIKRPDKYATGSILIQIQKGKQPAQDIVIKNNIIHDSYKDDLLKINNSCINVLVEGNVFYNQGPNDEHIDLNGVYGVTIQDNIFFNDFAGSHRKKGQNTNSFIVVKNSAGLSRNQNVVVRRNIFLNWNGLRNNSFLLIGEDGNSYYEARDVLIENNLMIGNSLSPMRAPFGVRGAKDIVFRSNTVTGDLPATAFGFSIIRIAKNPKNKNIRFYNNVWSDPTGTMEKFSEGDDSAFEDVFLDRNLYYNGGETIPFSNGTANGPSDRHALIGNPILGEQKVIILPRWIPEQNTFLSGSGLIRQEFERFVKLYGMPGSGSRLIDAADPQNSPSEDILGTPRGDLPDLGACEAQK